MVPLPKPVVAGALFVLLPNPPKPPAFPVVAVEPPKSEPPVVLVPPKAGFAAPKGEELVVLVVPKPELKAKLAKCVRVVFYSCEMLRNGGIVPPDGRRREAAQTRTSSRPKAACTGVVVATKEAGACIGSIAPEPSVCGTGAKA